MYCKTFQYPVAYVALVAPAAGAMRRGRQNYELKVFGCKNVPYVGKFNVWLKASTGDEKIFEDCKKIIGAPKISAGGRQMLDMVNVTPLPIPCPPLTVPCIPCQHYIFRLFYIFIYTCENSNPPQYDTILFSTRGTVLGVF